MSGGFSSLCQLAVEMRKSASEEALKEVEQVEGGRFERVRGRRERVPSKEKCGGVSMSKPHLR